MANKVIHGRFVTFNDLPVNLVIDGASRARLRKVVVLGVTEDGEDYLASSQADNADTIWLMEILKFRLLRIAGRIVAKNREDQC